MPHPAPRAALRPVLISDKDRAGHAPRRPLALPILCLSVLCLALTMSPKPAPAEGTYGPGSPAYSGGQFTTDGGTPANDLALGGAWGFAASYGAVFPYGCSGLQTYGGSLSGSGTITAHLKWNPDTSLASDPPPPLILVETCNNSYSGGVWPGTTFSGSAPDPFGPATVPPYTRYSAPPGGATLTATCAPAVTVSGSGSLSAKAVYTATAQVVYSAVAYPVTVSLGGVKNVGGSYEALTGQPVTASVVVGPSASGNTLIGCKISNYQWQSQSESGGTIIGSYSASQASGATTSPVSTSPSVTFYDNVQDTVMISVTATVTFPDNTTGTVSAMTQCSIVSPTITGPMCYLVENDSLVADNYGAQENIDNIQITDPGTFTGGVGCIVQKITSTSRVDSRIGGTNYTQKEDPTGTGSWGMIPVPCLDTDFPYPYGSSYSPAPNKFSAGWLVNPQTQGEGYDYPYVLCTPPLVSTDTSMNTNWNSSMGNDHFTDWIMYNPAVTAGGVWIPLKKFSWYWSNMATLNTNSGVWSAPHFMGDSGNSSIMPATDWPMWNAFTPYASSGRIQMRP